MEGNNIFIIWNLPDSLNLPTDYHSRPAACPDDLTHIEQAALHSMHPEPCTCFQKHRFWILLESLVRFTYVINNKNI